MKRELIDMMNENSLRAESIIHLATMLAHEQWPEAAKEAFMEEEPERIWSAIGIEPPYDLDDEGLIFEHLMDHSKLGYLVSFATPVPQDINHESWRLSWGYYRMKWIYADTYESACYKALEWREKFVSQKREEALKDLAEWQGQLKEHGPTCPECGEGAMNPKNPADPECNQFYCGECLFNDSDEDGGEL
ncbi:hypothetical protein [Marinobacter nauticus]|uniref:hypothetical protein n=1 Tax=Marinobacter nauticus TaxID=2743 RepID=UPI001C99F22B|nr:hypothetical protein [Marinobacter nauticus]MBY5938021.1 hypothetical protein [Marinobacter nauticus]MBY5955250.1 hypothetical protein [Marinobacter nauticus]MBY6009041.1 hypothetical protein [Marinobacter nauticus]